MKTNKLLLLLPVLAVILLSFSGDVKPFNNADKWIPADFDTRHSTLLVVNFEISDHPNNFLKKAQDKATNDMKEIMQEQYHYKYAFASAAEIKNSSKYADKDVYRWVLSDVNTMKSTLGGMGNDSRNVFHLYDRKIDKHYPDTDHPSPGIAVTFKPTVATIVKYLKELK